MLRILYVEDNAANLSLVHRVARVGGHEVVNRTSGEAALEDFDKIKADLVLMDIQLEGVMDGLEVVRTLRKRGCQLPIVAVTAYAMKGDKEKALEAGCDAYLSKPLPIDQLVKIIQEVQQGTFQQRMAVATAPPQTSEADSKPVKATAETTEATVIPQEQPDTLAPPPAVDVDLNDATKPVRPAATTPEEALASHTNPAAAEPKIETETQTSELPVTKPLNPLVHQNGNKQAELVNRDTKPENEGEKSPELDPSSPEQAKAIDRNKNSN